MGTAPPEFILKTFFRTLIIFLFLLVIVRVLGKRMKAQLSSLEMAVMITLGAIFSVPMQVPERGILQGISILVLALLIQRGISWLELKSERFERITHGSSYPLVKDGVLQLDMLRKARITHQELFAKLRSKEIYHLGKVDRVYLENDGLFSIYEHKGNDRAGLSILPAVDPIPALQIPTANKLLACCNCGKLTQAANHVSCSSCSCDKWTVATL